MEFLLVAGSASSRALSAGRCGRPGARRPCRSTRI